MDPLRERGKEFQVNKEDAAQIEETKSDEKISEVGSESLSQIKEEQKTGEETKRKADLTDLDAVYDEIAKLNQLVEETEIEAKLIEPENKVRKILEKFQDPSKGNIKDIITLKQECENVLINEEIPEESKGFFKKVLQWAQERLDIRQRALEEIGKGSRNLKEEAGLEQEPVYSESATKEIIDAQIRLMKEFPVKSPEGSITTEESITIPSEKKLSFLQRVGKAGRAFLSIIKTSVVAKVSIPQISIYSHQVNATYEKTFKKTENGKWAWVIIDIKEIKEGIVDHTYVNPKLGFAFVVDHTGHSKPDQKEGFDNAFSQYFEESNQGYQDALNEEIDEFKTVEDVKNFMTGQIRAFSIKNENHVLSDPYTFAQLVKIRGKKHLVVQHAGDCMILIKRQNGEIEKVRMSTDKGGLGGKFEITDVKVHSGDEIFGFSDGIGDFMTKDQVEKIIEENINRESLLSEFKKKIIQEGEKFYAENETLAERKAKRKKIEDGKIKIGNKIFGGKNNLKYHDPEDKNFHDDISLFTFEVP